MCWRERIESSSSTAQGAWSIASPSFPRLLSRDGSKQFPITPMQLETSYTRSNGLLSRIGRYIKEENHETSTCSPRHPCVGRVRRDHSEPEPRRRENHWDRQP